MKKTESEEKLIANEWVSLWKSWIPKLRWFATEIVVVVAGVLIALALNAWWSQIQNTQKQQILMVAVSDELATNVTSLNQSVEAHRGIADAIERAQIDGSSEAVHQTAVIERELWEPQTTAIKMLISFQSTSKLDGSKLRIELGSVLELIQKYQEREHRAAEFQDRARERIAELGLPIFMIFSEEESNQVIFSDQIMLNYLTLRYAEEAAAIAAAAPLIGNMQAVLEYIESLN